MVFNAVSISTAASHAPGAISTGATCAVDAPSDSAASSHWKPSPSRSQRRRTTPTALAGILVAMLALHVRLSAAFVATGSRVLTSHISSVAGSYLPRGGSAAMHSRLYGSITRGRMERLPWDVGAGKLTTKLLPRRSSALMSTASHSALSGKEEEGEDSSMAEGARNDTQRWVRSAGQVATPFVIIRVRNLLNLVVMSKVRTRGAVRARTSSVL